MTWDNFTIDDNGKAMLKEIDLSGNAETLRINMQILKEALEEIATKLEAI